MFLSVLGFELPVYGVFYASGCIAAVLTGFLRCKRQGLDLNDAMIIAACSLGCGLIASKLLFLLVSVPKEQLLRVVRAGRFDVLMSGGQVYLGGVLGGVLGGALGGRIAGCELEGYLRAFVPPLPLGHALGRIGCLFAGCCYGVPYTGFGAVTYAHAAGGAPPLVSLFPVQALEAAADVLIFAALMRFSARVSGKKTLAIYGLLYCPARFALEYLRFDALRGAFCGLSTSQWLCAAIFAVSALCWFRPVKSEIA